MTGAITAITANRVTIDGTEYAFPEAVRWSLEYCLAENVRVDVVIRDGQVSAVHILGKKR